MFKKGNIPWSKGKKLVEQKTEIILCKCGCGNELNQYDSRNRPRSYISNHFKSPILGKKEYIPSHKGIKHTLETKKQISRNRKGKATGPSNKMWKGGISFLYKRERDRIMETFEYKLWRKSVFERDNYTCQHCGVRGNYLEADHIKPFAYFPELRFELSNGRTLCKPCHLKLPTHGKRYIMSIL